MKFSGNAAPTQSLGRAGDTYEQTGGAVWEKFPGSFGASAYWDVIATPAELVPTGPAGRDGRDGRDGAGGQQGPAGADGSPGYSVAASQTTDFTAAATANKVYPCDTSSAAFTATLPSPTANLTLSFILTAGGGNLLTVSGTGLTAYLVKTGDALTVIADGTNWRILHDARQPFGVRVSKSINQGIASATVTVIAWNVETYDDALMHSVASNTSRLVCPVAGIYDLSFFINFAANATGLRQVLLNRNSSVTQEYDDIKTAPSSGECHLPGVFTFLAAAGDYFEINVYQDSGVILNVSLTNTYAALSLRRRTN